GLAPAPLVGRQQERAALISHLQAALNSLGGLVLVEGQAGVGKTRLLQELARDAEWRDVQVLWGHSREIGDAGPFAPWLEALQSDISPLRVEQWHQLVDPIWLRVLRPLLPELAAVVPEPPPALEPERERERLVNAFAQLLAGWSQAVPLLLILEDLHWAGDDTLALLTALAGRLRPHKVLIVGSYRGDEARAQAAMWQKLQDLYRAGPHERLLLGSLDAAASGDLIRRSLGTGQAAPLFEDRLHRETGGNPLFLLESLRALQDEGLLFRDEAGRWNTPWDATTATYAELPLPIGVQDVIARRLTQLTAQERAVLQTAAVLGSGFSFRLLQETAGQPADALLPVVYTLVRRRFLEEQPAAYRFSHDQIREVTYRLLPPSTRLASHRQAAQALEALHRERVPDLAYHFFEGQVWDRAAHYHRLAGKRAADVYANHEAVKHYTLALDALDRCSDSVDVAQVFELHLAREAVLARLGERAAQARDLAALQEMLANPALDVSSRRLQVALRQTAFGDVCSDYALALAAVDEATRLAQNSGDLQAEGQARARWGRLLRQRGELGAAHHQFEQALQLARTRDDVVAQALLLHDLGTLYFEQGDYGQALEYAQSALDRYPPDGDPGDLAAIHNNLGNLFHYVADFPSALEHYHQALALRRAIGDRRLEAMTLYNLSATLHDSGDPTAARQMLEQVCTLTHAVGDKRVEGYAWTFLGLVLEDQAEWDAADTAYRTGLALRREVGLHALAVDALSGLARVASARKEHEQAVQNADQVLAWLQEHGPDGVGDPCLAYMGAYQALLAAGEIERGQAALRAAYDLLITYAHSLADPVRRQAYLHDIEPGRTIWNDYQALVSTQQRVRLPRIDAPTGRPLQDDEYATITWTVKAPQDEALANKVARRRTQLCRLLRQAFEQAAAPTVDDLAAALDVSRATVKRDLAALRRAGHEVRTRGSEK
ncbi:MAG: tetratricopeptide repeat protein, partial [Anaerolineae bacterium]